MKQKSRRESKEPNYNRKDIPIKYKKYQILMPKLNKRNVKITKRECRVLNRGRPNQIWKNKQNTK